MLSKLAVSFSIICVASLGALHHGSVMQQEGEQVTQLQSNDPEPTETIPVKFVQDEEEEHESHLHTLHEHLNAMFKKFHNQFHHAEDIDEGEHEEEIRLNSFEFEDLAEVPVVEGLWIPDQSQHDGPLRVQFHDGDQPQNGVYRLQVKDPESGENEFTTVEMEFKNDLPILSGIPFIGHMFKNVDREHYRLKARTKLEYDPQLPRVPREELHEENTFEFEDDN